MRINFLNILNFKPSKISKNTNQKNNDYVSFTAWKKDVKQEAYQEVVEEPVYKTEHYGTCGETREVLDHREQKVYDRIKTTYNTFWEDAAGKDSYITIKDNRETDLSRTSLTPEKYGELHDKLAARAKQLSKKAAEFAQKAKTYQQASMECQHEANACTKKEKDQKKKALDDEIAKMTAKLEDLKSKRNGLD